VLMASVFSLILLNISFQQGLMGNNLRHLHDLVAVVELTRLNGVADVFVWGLHLNRQFSVRSMYNALIADSRVMLSKTL
jgi:hypothetical protein